MLFQARHKACEALDLDFAGSSARFIRGRVFLDCHATPRPASSSDAANVIIDNPSPYLVDSGGQYLTATTDLTRTLMLGNASYDTCDAYTAVMKGFLSLRSLRFPVWTRGHQFDA